MGREWQALAWLARHPMFVLVPVVLWWALSVFDGPTVMIAVAVLVATVAVWWRAHPASFDRFAAPRLRSTCRRWTVYRGGAWRAVLDDCELTRENRRTGQTITPRILRVRSVTRSIDVVHVRMARGQDVRMWTDHADALAHALFAHRVAITKKRPGVLAVTVERSMPFEHVVPAPDIPGNTSDVDLSCVDIGDDEYGRPFTIPIAGKHTITVGASGAGKGSLMWGPLRVMGPLIRDDLVRIHMIDLKGGAETEQGAPLFYRYAIRLEAALVLLTEFRDAMLARQEWMRVNKLRRCEMSAETPVQILMVDELAMLTAYGKGPLVREALKLLAEIMTQGRASLFSVMGYIQEPTKDVLEIRDLFTMRICLGVTTASHVDMVLGDGARERGALADEIPGDERHAGIGFVIDKVTRAPIRFRAGYVTDTDIAELVARCTPNPTIDDRPGLMSVPDNDDDIDDDQEDEDDAA